MALPGPIALVYTPILSIFLAVVSLSQFKIVYALLVRAASGKAAHPLLEAVQNALRQQLSFAQAIFGQPATFTPSVTHVLLVALMICWLISQRR